MPTPIPTNAGGSIVDTIDRLGLDALGDGRATAEQAARWLVSGIAPDELAATAEVAGMGTGEVIGLFLVPAVLLGGLILLLSDMAVLLGLKWLRERVGGVPLVGGPLSGIIGAIIPVFINIGYGLEAVVIDGTTSLVSDLMAIGQLFMQLLGIPTYRQWESLIGAHTAPIYKDLGGQKAGLLSTQQAVGDIERHLTHEAHALWSRLTAVEHDLNKAQHDIAGLSYTQHWMRQQLGQLWAWVHKILSDVHALTVRVTHLANDLVRLQKRVGVLETEVQRLTHELHELERVAVPAAETTAVLALLLPLIATGVSGLTNLENLARDPCRCFHVPGDPGWLLQIEVAELQAAHGV